MDEIENTQLSLRLYKRSVHLVISLAMTLTGCFTDQTMGAWTRSWASF